MDNQFQHKQSVKQDFNAGVVTSRLLGYGVTIKYAAGIANEICNLENYCRDVFINKADLDDVIKHYFARIETKLSAARVESLRWYICATFAQASVIIAAIALFK